MTSTDIKIGLTSSTRPSSRVLKPPGGGHTNIFGEPDVKVNAPRPEYNQQNSSNLNACMNSIDPNKIVEKIREEQAVHTAEKANEVPNEPKRSPTSDSLSSSSSGDQQKRGRIPPGGFSSGGFW